MNEIQSDNTTFSIENDFYLSVSPRRISKFIAHFKLYTMCLGLSGAVVECGVFKGVSLARWAKFRALFASSDVQQIVAFDTFGQFPEADYEKDKKRRDKFVEEAGSMSISVKQMKNILYLHGLEKRVDLIEGDIAKTIPEYLNEHSELRISLLNIDVDLYAPTKVALEHLYPLVVEGGVVILDDWGVFPGATRAIEEYFIDIPIKIRRFDFAPTPSYFIKSTQQRNHN